MFAKLAGSILGIALVGAGLFVPIHFGAVSSIVLLEAGAGSAQVTELAQTAELRNMPSVAEVLGKSVAPPAGKTRRLLGGSEPFLQTFLQGNPTVLNSLSDDPTTTAKLFIQKDFLAEIENFLAGSEKVSVQQILTLRDVTTWQTFPPVYSVGGRPLRATLMWLALAEQGGHLSSDLVAELSQLIPAALQKDRDATRKLEQGLLTLLSLSARTTVAQLVYILPNCRTWSDLVAFNKILQSDVPLAVWYPTLALAQDWGLLNNYVSSVKLENAEGALRLANEAGRGAVTWMLEKEYEIYQPPLLFAWFEGVYENLLGSQLFAWFSAQPEISIFLKILLIVLGAFVLSVTFFSVQGTRQAPSVAMLQHSCTAAILGIVMLLGVEPNLLEAQHQQENKLTLSFSGVNSLESLESHMIDLEKMDPVTLFILALFFLVQFVIYIIGLMKVFEIRGQKLPPQTRIQLLENEDLLFDFGLYVGLGGTVISLIMLAIGIVEASLIAAYASTLFGIIFVAILKIIHVRPLKRRLILEANL